jgi:hypothetical protein
MNAEIIVAIVAAVGGLMVSIVTYIRSRNSEEKKMRFEQEQGAKTRYHTQLSRINKYREPLIQACLDLYNYCEAIFYRDRNGLETERDKLEIMYAFGQLFAGMEVVRRALIEFNFDDAKLNMDIRNALGLVYSAFEDANYTEDISFLQTYMEQRALGELMLNEKQHCIEYTDFIKFMNDPGFSNWFRGIKNSLIALEMCLTQFDAETYHKIKHGELHAWEDDMDTGLCKHCGCNKSSGQHGSDVTAHFNRLYRIYGAIINLAKVLDFEKKRVNLTYLKRDIKPRPLWHSILCCRRRVVDHDTGTSIIVDRIRRDFVNRIVQTHKANQSSRSASSSTNNNPLPYLRMSSSLGLVVDMIELILKLRIHDQIVEERSVCVPSNILVSQLRNMTALEFTEYVIQHAWDPERIILRSLASNLDIDMKLSQYGLRSGSIIYITYSEQSDSKTGSVSLQGGSGDKSESHTPEHVSIAVLDTNGVAGSQNGASSSSSSSDSYTSIVSIKDIAQAIVENHTV